MDLSASTAVADERAGAATQCVEYLRGVPAIANNSVSMGYEYNVRSCTVGELLRGDSSRFVVPEFQRPYSWTPDEIRELFEDVLEDRPLSTGKVANYFLGSIVLIPRDDELVVVDGQQRLATISMVLAVLRQHLKDYAQHEDAELISPALITKSFGQDKRPRLTLQPKDAAAYRYALENPSAVDGPLKEMHRVTRAAVAIRSEIRARVEAATSDPHLEVRRIAERFFERVEFVRIDAASEGAAFRLFETLNARGKGLNAADLIKNKIFSRAGRNLQSVRMHWNDLQAAATDRDLLAYLRHYWIAFRASVRQADLYEVYDHEIRNATPEEVARLIAALAKGAAIYRGIATPRKIDPHSVLEAVAERLLRLDRLRAKSGRSLILAFAQRWPGALPLIVNMMETASIRHSLVGKRNPNQLEKAYARICESLRSKSDSDIVDAVNVVQAELSRAMPSDEEFRNDLVAADVRTNLSAWRLLLVALEEANDTGEKRVSGPSAVHIEHVLPQKPSKACLREAQLSAEEAAPLSYRLGNITLLLGKKNIGASNAPFSKKKDFLRGSSIAMTAAIAQNAQWRAEEIEERTQLLADAACKVWPWPPTAVTSSKTKRFKSPLRSQTRHAPGQVAIPEAAGDIKHDRLDAGLTLKGTVWIPRLLWALESAAAQGLGPITPSEIARLLSVELETPVQRTNTARAFRDLRKDVPVAFTWWEQRGTKYAITIEGRRILAQLKAGQAPEKHKTKRTLAHTRPKAEVATARKLKRRAGSKG